MGVISDLIWESGEFRVVSRKSALRLRKRDIIEALENGIRFTLMGHTFWFDGEYVRTSIPVLSSKSSHTFQELVNLVYRNREKIEFVYRKPEWGEALMKTGHREKCLASLKRQRGRPENFLFRMCSQGIHKGRTHTPRLSTAYRNAIYEMAGVFIELGFICPVCMCTYDVEGKLLEWDPDELRTLWECGLLICCQCYDKGIMEPTV